jgi:pyruvate formate lyase activating enzyme
MEIKGLQKLTLLDFPGITGTTVFIGGCNFRCPFCQNSDLVVRELEQEAEKIDEDAFFAFLETRKGLVDGVCVSGGEPTIHHELPEFIAKIKLMGFKVKLDTNGSNPRMLASLIEDDMLDYVAMDIKNDEADYARTAGLPPLLVHNVLARVCESIDILKESGIEYEFRTTAIRGYHTRESFAELGHLIEGAEKYYIQNFKDSGRVIEEGLSGFSREELEEFATAVEPFVKHVELRGID